MASTIVAASMASIFPTLCLSGANNARDMTLKITMMEKNSDIKGAVHVTPAQWEQRRYEIARDIMAAAFVTNDNRGMKFSDMAFDAVRVADALISELKGE